MTPKHSETEHTRLALNTAQHAFLKGVYKDRLTDPNGVCLWESGWRSNLVVDRCNRLLAALMKRQPGISGILYWAVGDGAAAWDRLIPGPNADDQQLAHEIARKALSAEQIFYLDENNEAAEGPTARLQIGVTFTREALGGQGVLSLREFGLFGGDATEAANSGWMIDYVIHPRIPLSAGMTLTRSLHLTFGVGAGLGESSGGFGRALPVISIDGVGQRYADALNAAGVTALGDLIEIDPLKPLPGIPGVKLREFRAKTRMVLGLRGDFRHMTPLAQRSISDLLKETPDNLVRAIKTPGVTSEQVMRIQETLAMLQVAMDDDALRRMTLDDLIHS